MTGKRSPSAGFSLIELMLVIALLAIFAGLIIPNGNPSVHQQLRSTGRVLAADLAYCQSLAITNDSEYKITFEAKENRYFLKHSNPSKPELNVLPDTAFSNPDDPPTQDIVNISDLPYIGRDVSLLGAATGGGTPSEVSRVEFGTLGEIIGGKETVIWLSAGAGSATRYITININSVTGLAALGDLSGVGPSE